MHAACIAGWMDGWMERMFMYLSNGCRIFLLCGFVFKAARSESLHPLLKQDKDGSLIGARLTLGLSVAFCCSMYDASYGDDEAPQEPDSRLQRPSHNLLARTPNSVTSVGHYMGRV